MASPSRTHPLTRRRFLEHLGAVGGSSLVISAMSSWDLMASSAGQRPALSGRPANARVLVLGAGLSGLVAAYELGKLGYDYQVLEARDRVGGLQWSVRRGSTHTEVGGETQVCTFDEGQYINMGPWRIPASHEGILGYCKELGVPLEVFLNESDASYFFYEGTGAGPLSNRRVRLREVKADLTGHVNELLLKAIDQHMLEVPLTAEDQDRLKAFLVRQGYLDSRSGAYKAFDVRGGGDPYALADLLQAGFGSRVRSVAPREGTTAGMVFQPVGGMDQIAIAFQRAMGPERITLNAEVQSVRQSGTGVTVVCRDTTGGRTTTLHADYVILALPLPIVSTLDINLSDHLMRAVADVTYSNSAKIGLAMKRRFWEEDDHIFGGHLYSNLPIGEFSYPSYGYFSRKGVLLGLYANGPIGNLIGQPIAARIEHTLAHASKVHPQIRTEFESGYAVFWKKVPYSLGGYASGRNAERKKVLSTLDNRVVIGSAATAPQSEPDWQEGAVAAGWQALQTVHERAMRG